MLVLVGFLRVDAIPNPNPPYLSGLGTGTELGWLAPPVIQVSLTIQ